MQISKIDSNSNPAFQSYKITENGLRVLKSETNPELKRALIDCCEYFKDKKYASVRICQDRHGGTDLNLDIPDCDYWIKQFEIPYCDPRCNDKGIYINTDYSEGGSGTIFVNLNGKRDDGNFFSKPQGRMVSLFRELEKIDQYNIFEKIKAFKMLGDEVEKARKAIETSQQMNSEIDNLFAKQNY